MKLSKKVKTQSRPSSSKKAKHLNDYSVYAEPLMRWFEPNKRPLPWRRDQDPYKIWISETMLQQTTTTAVIPYFEKFIKKLPNLKSLSKASEEELFELWAGLGYYSRARNLLKAAKELAQLKSFPQSYRELLNYSGFGPYTSRAVSSIAFNEPVGVIDGNVIRVFSRFYGEAFPHWQTSARVTLQNIADLWAQSGHSSQINQALMELGATICIPKNPKCLLCPLTKNCLALKNKTIEKLPLKKPRKSTHILFWEPLVHFKNKQIALTQNNYAPFLKKQLLLPGKITTLYTPPKEYHFKHMITHYEIYVKVKKTITHSNNSQLKWVLVNEVKKHTPASLIHKALQHAKVS